MRIIEIFLSAQMYLIPIGQENSSLITRTEGAIWFGKINLLWILLKQNIALLSYVC